MESLAQRAALLRDSLGQGEDEGGRPRRFSSSVARPRGWCGRVTRVLCMLQSEEDRELKARLKECVERAQSCSHLAVSGIPRPRRRRDSDGIDDGPALRRSSPSRPSDPPWRPRQPTTSSSSPSPTAQRS